MKILVASPYLPWPLDAGGKVALFSSLACLKSDHRFTLVCPVYSEEGLTAAASLQAELPDITVRAVYCGPPQRETQRKENILLRSLRCGVRRYRGLQSPPTQVSHQGEEQVLAYYPFGPLPEPYVDALAAELHQGVDLVQAEFADMLSLGPWLPRGVPKIFIHHQLHFVYARRLMAARKQSVYGKYREEAMYVAERAYLKAFDGVVVFSDEDKRALSAMLPAEKVYVSPFPIEGGDASSSRRSEVQFSFVGSDAHFPNRDGLEWLITDVWPEIRKQIPDCKLRVIGPWSEALRVRLLQPGIEFTGYVDDLQSATQGTVLLVPLRIGSGIRVKLLDAMAQGVPAVSTSIGCEGIPAVDGVDLLIRNTAAEFAAASVELINFPELRSRLASAGRDLVARLYSPEQVRKRRNEIYRSVCGALSQPTPD